MKNKRKGRPGTNESKQTEKLAKSRVSLSQGKKVLFTLIFYSLIILSLVGVEVSLRHRSYGVDTHVFIQPTMKSDIYVDNISLQDKYFSKQLRSTNHSIVHSMIRNVFSKDKPEDTLRGFFIGESSVQGFPFDSNHSFSKITEMALMAGGKYKNVEIMNLGVSAMTSYYIRDVALKVLKYQPDFILIYAGHNEYYGNVSYTTGGNRLSKNLYLFLKEFKTFQWIFDRLEKDDSGTGADTLMEKQFRQHKVPSNAKVDRQVAQDFIANIDIIVQTYAKKKIPVIIVEPVCNLVDMPPFAGENDEAFKRFIKEYHAILLSGDKERVKEFYAERLRTNKYDQNANVIYLDAMALRRINGKTDISLFTKAKDLDSVPFRVRSRLVSTLRDYSHTQEGRLDNFSYIPLSDILLQEYGSDIFSNEIFIDQLHFNQRGHRLVSKIITRKIADLFKYDREEKKRVDAYFLEDASIDRTIHYLPAYKIASSRSIKNLVSASPFTEMLIPYQNDPRDDFVATNDSDKGLESLLVEKFSETKSFSVKNEYIVNYYLAQQDFQTAQQYADAYVHVYPGSYKTHLLRARFHLLIGNIERATEDYINAYLLSEKMSEIYREMEENFSKVNRSYIFHRIEREYGKPINE